MTMKTGQNAERSKHNDSEERRPAIGLGCGEEGGQRRSGEKGEEACRLREVGLVGEITK
jgi:hypothetical protein